MNIYLASENKVSFLLRFTDSVKARDSGRADIQHGLFQEAELHEKTKLVPVDPAFDNLSVFDPVDLNAGPGRSLSRRGMAQIVAGLRC